MPNRSSVVTKLRPFRWIIVAAVLVLLLAAYQIGAGTSDTPKQSTKVQPEKTALIFDKRAHSNEDASSVWVIVNKKRPLQPETYTPDLTVPRVKLKGRASAQNMQLETETARALERLFAAAKQNGHELMLSSGYRSFAYQRTVYNRIIASEGQVAADTVSARPGHSEHQTGLSADIAPASRKCDLDACFGKTPEGMWLANNSWRYGFIVRYTESKTQITGYSYEPWHFRYVGKALATEMHDKNVQTLEEFFNTGPAPTY